MTRASPLRTQDFWAGALYMAVGLLAVWYARDFRLGTAGRMGPGYFPILLGGFLSCIGALSMLRAFIRSGAVVERMAGKPLVLVVAATLVFAVLLQAAGFFIALGLAIFTAAMASQYFKVDLKAVAGLALFVTVCALIFVKGLGLPMPMLGHWFKY